MDYKQTSDIRLWECCRQDDLRAYRELFHRYAPKLYKQAVGIIKDTMTAEELVMDLLFTMWQKRHEPIMQGEVAPYFFRAMRNQVLKHLRRNLPQNLPIENLSEELFVEQREADYGLRLGDTNRIYENSLSLLSPQRREAFRLSREENLSYAEIATAMNLSVNTVENYIASALKILRQSRLTQISNSVCLLMGTLLF